MGIIHGRRDEAVPLRFWESRIASSRPSGDRRRQVLLIVPLGTVITAGLCGRSDRQAQLFPRLRSVTDCHWGSEQLDVLPPLAGDLVSPHQTFGDHLPIAHEPPFSTPSTAATGPARRANHRTNCCRMESPAQRSCSRPSTPHAARSEDSVMVVVVLWKARR